MLIWRPYVRLVTGSLFEKKNIIMEERSRLDQNDMWKVSSETPVQSSPEQGGPSFLNNTSDRWEEFHPNPNLNTNPFSPTYTENLEQNSTSIDQKMQSMAKTFLKAFQSVAGSCFQKSTPKLSITYSGFEHEDPLRFLERLSHYFKENSVPQDEQL
ncbi:uncharacterized protein LOC115885522 [Sitophilus oryzae]|uniref:Uncharacterized protein LOC115885522 n=1 Tax=Sitophilus oryzae TaxID=7048 RepID=A0A6J2Y909_SITOR|nr:uncharacterized protein LOC115885522 [Sitophilus oryzae]